MQRSDGNTSQWRTMLVLGLGIVIFGLGGCKSSIDFNYSPLAAVDTLSMEGNSSQLMCVNFVDERTTQKVGGARNLYGMKVSSFVFSQEDLKRAFTTAVTDTLRKAGYKVAMNSERITGENIPAGELQNFDYLVGGRILTISVNTKPGWSNVKAEASVEIDVHIRKIAGDQEGMWIGPISGESLKQSYAVMDLSNAAERALNNAMQNCMVNLVRHLKATGIAAVE